MICDESATIRKLGFNRILKARENADAGKRTFLLPKIICEAKKFYGIIN